MTLLSLNRFFFPFFDSHQLLSLFRSFYFIFSQFKSWFSVFALYFVHSLNEMNHWMWRINGSSYTIHKIYSKLCFLPWIFNSVFQRISFDFYLIWIIHHFIALLKFLYLSVNYKAFIYILYRSVYISFVWIHESSSKFVFAWALAMPSLEFKMNIMHERKAHNSSPISTP